MKKPPPSSRVGLAVACSLTLALGACTATTGSKSKSVESTPPKPPPQSRSVIVMDGWLNEWPSQLASVADDDYLYLKLSVEGGAQTLQSSDETLTIALDVDANPNTGTRLAEPSEAQAMGVDLIIKCSPRGDEGEGRGVALWVADANGATREVAHTDLDFMFSPTYASPWYEARLTRHTAHLPELPSEGLATSGAVVGMYILENDGGEIVGWSDRFTTPMPPASRSAPLADVSLPTKPEGAVRVMSWNVLRSAPMEDGAPFADILAATEPDIVLVQEWDVEDERDLLGWFTAMAPSDSGWYVSTNDAWGVGVVSRYPVEPLLIDPVYVDGSDRPVRVASAIVRTPNGNFAVASTHLKCCGSKGSPEDQTRMAEAMAINGAMSDAMNASDVSVRIIAGDMNLVGSRPPLDLLRTGLDADGSDLEPVDAFVLGDSAIYTWTDDKSEFSPGRLDFMVVGDAQSDVVQSFVLDTARLSDSALARIGLTREHSRASDHLPVIADIRAK